VKGQEHWERNVQNNDIFLFYLGQKWIDLIDHD